MIIRRITLIAICLLLGGCAEYLDASPYAFDPGGATPEKYRVDSRLCEREADQARSYGAQAITADEGERHRIYNASLQRCMQAYGYERRIHWYNLWEEYDW